MMADICGMTPLAMTLRLNMCANPVSDSTPSCMRAPPESLSPMIGAPFLSARSWTLAIFCAFAALSDPPMTAKSNA